MLLPTPKPSASQVLDALTESVGCHSIAKGSGRGWSYYSTFMRCPKAFELEYLAEPDVDLENQFQNLSMALETGSIFHALQFFNRFDWGIEPGEVLAELRKAECWEEPITEAERLFTAYTDYWAADYLVPVAGELHAEYLGKTCRYDLIAEIPRGVSEFSAGLWAIDFKTASRFDDKTLDGWDLHGEITGQSMLWEFSGLKEKYGKLAGVMVDITGKQKTPQFARIPFDRNPDKHLDHLRSLEYVDAQLAMCQVTGYYPRIREGCIHRYGKCKFYDTCRYMSQF